MVYANAPPARRALQETVIYHNPPLIGKGKSWPGASMTHSAYFIIGDLVRAERAAVNRG